MSKSKQDGGGEKQEPLAEMLVFSDSDGATLETYSWYFNVETAMKDILEQFKGRLAIAKFMTAFKV